jgi:cysteine desulfurase
VSERAYLDHASTSPLRPVALEAMLPWMSAADPGRVHTEGRSARVALEEAREKVASWFGTRPRQVIFTSGATEAINAATFGALEAAPGPVVLAAVEHSAVREASVRYSSSPVLIGADRFGSIRPDEIRAWLAGRGAGLEPGGVSLVHCQLANHEVGTVQPVAEIVRLVAELPSGRRPLVHVDAAAAAGHVPIRFDELGADLISVSAHKFGGPRGIGALLVRRGLRLAPLILGGAQERARRGGLENVPAAVGFGAVAELLSEPGALEAEAARCEALASRLRAGAGRLPHLVCLGIGGVEAEPVLIGLDQAGVATHSGSSCSSEALEPSPVLEAMGVDADHSLRLSVGWSTTDREVDMAVAALPEVVGRLRELWAGGHADL